jgi:diaminopimelate decarboxylase
MPVGPPLEEIADSVGTPFYAYDLDLFRRRIRGFDALLAGIAHVTCYAVKANDALALLRIVASETLGADIVSGGELAKALRVGVSPGSIVFSGVAKQGHEIDAAIAAGIRSLNVESRDELDQIAARAAALGRAASVSVRLNPDVAGGTHAYLSTGTAASKFGLAPRDALAALRAAAAEPAVEPVGISFHIVSQIVDAGPFAEAARRAIEVWRAARSEGIALRDLDVGGGLGVPYTEGDADPDLASYIGTVVEAARSLGATLVVEPGRHVVAPAGVFVTRVIHVKGSGDRTIAICDGGINDLLRPLLYSAEHPLEVHAAAARPPGVVDVVGPLCESGDYLTLGRSLPIPEPGDLVVVGLAGAYGRVMSSTYNGRPLCAEVLLENGAWRLGRDRGTYDDLIRNEHL